MKIKLFSASMLAALATWAPHGMAREAVALPGVVGAEGVLNGVDTTGNASLTVANNQNINTNNDLGGAFTTANNNQGNILFLGNSTVTGATGTIGNRFLNVSAGVAGTTVDFNGSVFSTTINVSGTGTLNFNGNVTGAPVFAGDGFINLGAGRMLTGAITTNTANTGTLTLNGGSSVTGAIGGANGLKQINVAGGNAAVTGAVQAQGFNLGANTLVITGALTTNAGGVIQTTLASDAVFGKILVGTSNINAGGVTVIPTVTGALTNGTTYKIVDAPAGTIGAVVSVINNSPRYTFSGLPTSTGDVNIRLTGVAPLATLVTVPGAIAVAPILDVNAPANSDLLTVQDAIAVLPNTAGINNALAQLAPGTTNLEAPRVAGQTAQLFDDLWMGRVNEIQDICEPQRRAAPANSPQCKGFEQQGNWWGKGFGNVGRQRDVDEMSGYDTETYGLMLAYDIPLNTETRIGLGGGYANAKIDDNNSIGQTKLDSYQLTGYINHAPGPWFIRGALSVGIDRYDGSRAIVFPGVNRTASVDYKGHHYSAIVSAGQHFFINQTTITPMAGLQTSRIKVDSYSETGAGDVNLRVDSQDYDIVQSSLGVKAEHHIQAGDGNFYPEVHVKWLHDFTSTTMEQTAAFSGGGAQFKVQGIEQDRDLFNVGAGVSFLSCNCVENAWTVKGLYDYKWNQSKFSSHQVSVVASFIF